MSKFDLTNYIFKNNSVEAKRERFKEAQERVSEISHEGVVTLYFDQIILGPNENLKGDFGGLTPFVPSLDQNLKLFRPEHGPFIQDEYGDVDKETWAAIGSVLNKEGEQ
jgi:hypothetical protein